MLWKIFFTNIYLDFGLSEYFVKYRPYEITKFNSRSAYIFEGIIFFLNEDKPVERTYLQHLYTAKNYNHIWGMNNVIRAVDPETLRKYSWIMKEMTPSLDKLPNKQGYSVRSKYSFIYTNI